MEVTIEKSILMFSQDFGAFRAHICTNQRQQLLRSERWLAFALRGTVMRVSGEKRAIHARLLQQFGTVRPLDSSIGPQKMV